MADYGAKLRSQQADLEKLYGFAANQTPRNSFGLVPEQTIPASGNVHGQAGTMPPEVVAAYGVGPFGQQASVNLPPEVRGTGPNPVPTTGETDTEVPATGPGQAPMPQPQPSPGRYVAPSMTVTGRTTQKGFEDPESLAKIDEGQSREEAAIKAAALQGQAKAVEQAGFSAAMADQQEQFAVAKRAREYDREQKVAAAMAPMNALADELSTGKVDPSRYLENQSTGAKLATMLSVVLGAGAAQRINGRNVGLDMMNDAIARDVDAQKASFDMKRGALSAKQSLYGQMLQNFGREDIAADATQLALMKGYEAKIAAIGAKYAGTEAGNRAEMLLAQSQKNSGELGLKITDAMRNHTTEQEQLTGGGFVGGSGGGGGASPGIQELPAGKLVDLPDGRSVVVGRDEDATKLRSKIGASEEIIRNLEEIKKLRAGMSALSPIDSARAMASINALTESTKQIVTVHREQGAMSNGDASVATGGLGLKSIMINPGAIDTAVKELRSGITKNIEASGGAYVTHGFATDAKGNQKRTMQYTGETTNRPKAAADPVAVKPVT